MHFTSAYTYVLVRGLCERDYPLMTTTGGGGAARVMTALCGQVMWCGHLGPLVSSSLWPRVQTYLEDYGKAHSCLCGQLSWFIFCPFSQMVCNKNNSLTPLSTELFLIDFSFLFS